MVNRSKYLQVKLRLSLIHISSPVTYCKEQLKDSDVHVGAAIAFPLGQTTLETKILETQKAIADGADEIDYVINLSLIHI